MFIILCVLVAVLLWCVIEDAPPGVFDRPGKGTRQF